MQNSAFVFKYTLLIHNKVNLKIGKESVQMFISPRKIYKWSISNEKMLNIISH